MPPGKTRRPFYFSMNKLISLVLLAGGVVMIVYGVNSAESVSSDVSRLFTGSSTDRTLWLLIGGVVLSVLGAGGLMSGSSR